MARFEYKDGPKWPRAADGGGSSLVAISANADLDSPTGWHAGVQTGGTPGEAPLPLVIGRFFGCFLGCFFGCFFGCFLGCFLGCLFDRIFGGLLRGLFYRRGNLLFDSWRLGLPKGLVLLR